MKCMIDLAGVGWSDFELLGPRKRTDGTLPRTLPARVRYASSHTAEVKLLGREYMADHPDL